MPESPEKEASVPSIREFDYVNAVEGKEIYNFFGNRVVEHTTTAGEVLAVKVKPPDFFERSEADMMHYAATHNILAPKVRGVYDVTTRKPLARVMVSERVPGETLETAWPSLSENQRSSIKEQLRTQLGRMRVCTQPFIGRVNRQPTRNIYDRIPQTYCGPFDDEQAFDKWCLARLTGNPLIRWKWQRAVDKNRQRSSGRFVLTHGDLAPRNIMVQDGIITGIVDWEKSGFFPEYAEYAFAMALGHSLDKWWIDVLKEVLEPCPKEMVEFTRLVEDRGW